MARAAKSDITKRLMHEYGRTYSAEIGIALERDTPAPLFQWLVASLLFSARIAAPQAVGAARALFSEGWRTPEKMAGATWKQRVDVLNANGYARYDESTSRMLADTSEMLREKYGGDLRKLREEAGGDAKRAEKLLAEFKGIGPTGAAIFLREVQGPWQEFYPYADGKALDVAAKLDLGDDAGTLAGRVTKRDFPVFLTALVRAGLAGDLDGLKRNAS